jgi:thioesterase domain-containing protein
VRLFARIEVEYGVKLPLSSLFERGTVGAQARLIAASAPAGPWSPLVGIQPNGSRPPFFLVHGIGAEVLSFAKLAEHTGSDQPIFGLRPTVHDAAFFSTVESVASTYVAAIRTVEPHGPYRIGGYSSGGIIAYEMAQQLRVIGADVALLAMLDSFAPASRTALSPSVLWRMVKNAVYWPADDQFLTSSGDDKFGRVRSKINRLSPGADIRDRLGVWKFPESSRETLEAHYRMLTAYQAKPYAGALTVMRARTLKLSFRGPSDLGWGALARGGLDLHIIPGTHDNILTEPRVRRLAATLVACLGIARRGPAQSSVGA